ncbi:MAG: cob(I)alamin adenosyltransferase [Candidatus Azotimanducaceae bacterium]|jgi:cob(I)alamin adenosyltransferase
MGKRLSKIYTRTGDLGETGLGDGNRIKKDHIRIQTIGSIDELNSYIGLCIETLRDEDHDDLSSIKSFLEYNQHRIFDLGGEISIPGFKIINEDHVTKLESALDELNANLAPLENFILPGGHKLIAIFHICRSICRRAERDLVSLQEEEDINVVSLRYLNRLSDYLFVTARYTAYALKIDEVLWQKDI